MDRNRFAAEVDLPVALTTTPRLSQTQVNRIQRFLDTSIAANTKLAYDQAWKHFEAYCLAHSFKALPAEPEVVAAYIADLAETPTTRNVHTPVSTIQIRLSAIAFVHDKLGHKTRNPVREEAVLSVMAGIRRALGESQVQKAPITRELLVKLVRELPTDDAGTRDKALLLLGFALARRRSELVALDLDDVQIGIDAMTVNLKRSKTDQTGKGHVFTIKARPGDKLCVVTAVGKWKALVEVGDRKRLAANTIKQGRRVAEESEPPRPALFRAMSKFGTSSKARLSASAVAVIVKNAARMADLDEKSVANLAGHSLRAGFVTSAAEQGLPEWQIQEVTLHRSTATLRRYIRTKGKTQTSAVDAVLAGT